MINLINLNIIFKKEYTKNLKQNNIVNVLLLEDSKKLIAKPKWLSREIEIFLIKNNSNRENKDPYLVETNMGKFVLISGLNSKIINNKVELENLGGLIFDKVSSNIHTEVSFFFDNESLFCNLLQ